VGFFVLGGGVGVLLGWVFGLWGGGGFGGGRREGFDTDVTVASLLKETKTGWEGR